jgi:hypothetical protein
MLIVEYINDDNGIAFADYEALPRAIQIVNNLKKTNRLVDGADDYTISVSTENIVEAFRVLVVRKEIDHNQIMFKFEGRHLPINEHGMLSDWCKGFCDTIDNFHTEILQQGINRKIIQ